MNNERGATWNKWDFHVHTPYSLLNNGYGFNPFQRNSSEDLFDTYVLNLFNKAIEKEIVAIGITDYFFIDGYKRIVQNYLQDSNKMRQLFPDEEKLKKINEILIFPNIEFRLNTFVGNGNNSVNFHVIFSNELKISEIEDNFLHIVKLSDGPGNERPLTKDNLTYMGKEYKKHNQDDEDDFLVGLKQATVNYNEICDVLSNSPVLKEKYLISIPVDEDLSKIDWRGRDYQTRKDLYKIADLLMTSNYRTREWALAKGDEENRKSEFGSIKPCIWGSDAHCYDKLFSPDGDRYCWIKADTTFEGLKQVLYEPESRVAIQSVMPGQKDSHQVIDYIIFRSPLMQEKSVLLNDGLTTIIGGKSTGKSILLRHIAKAIDSKQVEQKEGLVSQLNSEKLNVEAEVFWRDGSSGERKIIYIPQSWLNHIVDEGLNDNQLNEMLRDIILQQEEIKNSNTYMVRQVGDIIKFAKHGIVDYIAAYKKIQDCDASLKEFGRSEAYQVAIANLQKQRENLSLEIGITDEDLKSYYLIENDISKQEHLFEEIKKEEQQIDFQKRPFVYLSESTKIKDDDSFEYDFSNFSLFKECFEKKFQKMNQEVETIWNETIKEIQQALQDKKVSIERTLARLRNDLKPLQDGVFKSEELKKIEKQIESENEGFRNAKKIEEIKADYCRKADEFKKNLILSRLKMREAYEAFAKNVSESNIKESNLEFKAEVRVRKQELFDAISGIFDNRSFRSFKDKSKYNISDIQEFSVDDELFVSLWDAMLAGELSFKAANTLQTALERLFSDWFEIHYTIKSGEDTIANMSPGKKALVLLELIVNLEKSKCPILIDQPEDDLDNRSIYKELVSYLKSKKKERQIIVVTHNANVVIGADAEEVIIANQDGKESPNLSSKFEYRSGAIENNLPRLGNDGRPLNGLLNQKGIQEQICDILEGGKEAFDLRQKKYIRSS